MTDYDELFSLEEQLYKSDAAEYARRIETLVINFSVFDKNYTELKTLIDLRLNHEKMNDLWDLKNRYKLREVILEIRRLLHNFLAAATSLVAHSRATYKNWYKDTKFLEEYQSQVNERFLKNPMTKFIEELRNYNLHYSHPAIRATFSFDIDKETGNPVQDFSFVILKSSLLERNEWKSIAKSFLLSCQDKIDLADLVDKYYRQIFDFNTWILHKLQDIHKEDLKWYEDMKKKIIDKMSDEEKRDRGLI